jgi:hypothetical protein
VNEAINKPPLANAGKDQVIALPADSILLDGSASTDPDGTIREWRWSRISGSPAISIDNAEAAKAMAGNLGIGIYLFELKVTDDQGLSAADTLKVTVLDPVQPNRPPVANAGSDTVITLPANTILLDGSGSTDPDQNISRFEWTKIAGPFSFVIVKPGEIQTQATNLVQGKYEFELMVADANGLLSRDTVQVLVNLPLLCPNLAIIRSGPWSRHSLYPLENFHRQEGI